MELGNAVMGYSRGDFPIPRHAGFEDELWRLFEAMAPDDWDYRGDWLYDTSDRGYSNKTFEIHPYCWCDRDDCPQCGSMEQPNFLHRATGLSIRWYKYPLRDSYANQEITLPKFKDIITGCIRSLTAKR